MWPSGVGTIPTNMQGATLVTDATDDHSLMHRQIGTILNALPTTLGSTPGTNLLRNISAASDQLVAANSGGTMNQTLTKGTANNFTFGTPAITGGTANNQVMGTPAITGGTFNNGVVGTPAITGGTANSMTLGTPTINGLPWTNFTPLMTGFSGTVNQNGQYVQIGNLMIVNYRLAGTSNGTAFTTSLPVAGDFSQTDAYFGAIRARDNGTISPNAVYDYESGTIINLYRDYNSTSWTASGQKSAYFTIMYRV